MAQVGNGIEDARWLVAPTESSRPFLRLMAEAGAALGGRVVAEPFHGRFGFYIEAGGRAHPVHGAALGLNGDAAARLAGDKDYAAKALGYAGVPVPEHVIVLAGRDAAPGLAWAAQEAGFPLWVKPNEGHGGEGVSRVADADALTAAMVPLRAAGRHVLLQAHVPGREFRVMVLEGRVVLAYERVGTGGGPGNLSAGAMVRDGGPGPDAEALAVRAVEALGLRWGGVDVIVGEETVVLEVNAAPGLDAYATSGAGQWAAARAALGAALEALGR
ncbi:ATP-grasp domain-containing protein [Vannielia litorea]|uniref:ATP-grasp domain-containing protein n=1 Tax=Vannielia litorea TaxID=1217970 RepID=UPI001BD11941|nr:ATP-grasp domain-containing protein [Vannielia litorea]MBS8225847.1 ATP-grasp domain-containing protein [Vannielia litorea]